MAISLTFNIRDCHAVARNDENRTLSTSPLRCVYSSYYDLSIYIMEQKLTASGKPPVQIRLEPLPFLSLSKGGFDYRGFGGTIDKGGVKP